YEIIGIDNSNNRYSIFTAYNEGVARSSYDILCFMHEDILFHTSDWGPKILKHLSESDAGIIGVCGGSTLSNVPASWSLFDQRMFILQSSARGRKSVLHKTGHDNHSTSKKALLLDGVFLCARKSVFQKIRFDDLTFSGFHSYDLDICTQAYLAGYKNYAINDVLIEHFSNGHHNKQWIVNTMMLTDKWAKLLPISLYPATLKHIEKVEFQYMTGHFAKCLIRAGYNNEECLHIITRYLTHHTKYHKKTFLHILLLKILFVRLTKRPHTLIIASGKH
ncbi:MAG: glycosyltransferase, partial [Bacteroidia bacterium]|nr:glycosyltransferase [Bacteroidia bacterium]